MSVAHREVGEYQRQYITPDQVCELIPGMSRAGLASLRFNGSAGPRFYKPSPRKVVYELGEVLAWIESTARTGTAAS